MTHRGTVELATPRLVLRRFTTDDAKPMFDTWASDPAVTRFLRWSPHRDWGATAELLHEWCKNYARLDFYSWAVCLRAGGTLIGSIAVGTAEADDGWQRPVPPAPHWEPGYAYGRAYWGRGYATEALCAVRDFWFAQAGGDFLACCHAVENPASGRVMQKAGFAYDHDAFYHRFDGSAVACRVYGLKKGMYGTAGT